MESGHIALSTSLLYKPHHAKGVHKSLSEGKKKGQVTGDIIRPWRLTPPEGLNTRPAGTSIDWGPTWPLDPHHTVYK